MITDMRRYLEAIRKLEADLDAGQGSSEIRVIAGQLRRR
jgi:hypothetical protein